MNGTHDNGFVMYQCCDFCCCCRNDFCFAVNNAADYRFSLWILLPWFCFDLGIIFLLALFVNGMCAMELHLDEFLLGISCAALILKHNNIVN